LAIVEFSGKLQAPVIITLGNNTGTHYIEGWVGWSGWFWRREKYSIFISTTVVTDLKW
jgi:hypothetical protein